MLELLAPGGGLSRAIPHYEDRAEQRAMSNAVARALAEGRSLVVEAGTGTGKTLAYLIPALMSGKRVVVSTATRTLQDQIARHDVPLLRSIVARSFSAVVLKGVPNYVCLRKLASANERLGPEREPLVDWAEHSATGDRAEIEWLAEDSALWSEVTTTPEARLGARCPYFDRCFITRARRMAERADLILVNHHLYLSDRAIRTNSPGARLLPEHDAVIFDEAHQLEDVATEHFGVRVSTHSVAQLVRDARLALGAMPLWHGHTADDRVAAVERAAIALFAAARGALLELGEPRAPLPDGFFAHSARQAAWFALDTALEELARLSDDATDTTREPDASSPELALGVGVPVIARRARAVRTDLAHIADQPSRAHVYWGEARASGTTLAASPIDVGDLMRRRVVRAGPTAVFTSATLATAGDFTYSRARLGLDDADELMVPSSFDYARQALLYVPRDLPLPTEHAFSEAAAARTLELLELTGGRAFLLFTSHRALHAAAARLASAPYPRLVQGDAPRAALVERFRSTPGAILLGTGAFWEGVDVPGDALSLVVIDKLPFASFTDPLVAARARVCAESGQDPFATFQLPAAALALKQGFGRLIRRRDDRGIVAVLDHRLVTKTYGRVFVETLPAGLPRTSSLEQARRWWRATR